MIAPTFQQQYTVLDSLFSQGRYAETAQKATILLDTIGLEDADKATLCFLLAKCSLNTLHRETFRIREPIYTGRHGVAITYPGTWKTYTALVPNRKEAIQHLDKAIKLNVGHVESWSLKVDVLAEEFSIEEAFKTCINGIKATQSRLLKNRAFDLFENNRSLAFLPYRDLSTLSENDVLHGLNSQNALRRVEAIKAANQRLSQPYQGLSNTRIVEKVKSLQPWKCFCIWNMPCTGDPDIRVRQLVSSFNFPQSTSEETRTLLTASK